MSTSQRDQELLCEFVRKSSTCAACQNLVLVCVYPQYGSWQLAAGFSLQILSQRIVVFNQLP
ncbi:uncharacterized protein Dvir_GJ26741 [Drosophila virilis]|uniref:Uncharacterized protein n=1 Tax=Drosophila virilis TaxID=7244 RepID=A0A0Q9WL06_DROVI|nr:uncharacterized protein Dvir_GJ26741 [Drosophila virilis]